MRASLADSSLTRHAGRFVWLELSFDATANKDFLLRQKVSFTPSLYVMDAASGRAIASHLGGMSLAALNDFLDLAGARASRSPADSALARGDELQGLGNVADATTAYRAALDRAPPGWPRRTYAVTQLTWALMTLQELRPGADLALAEAPAMKRDHDFARVALAGLMSANMGDTASWAVAARAGLRPLAAEAAEIQDATRDNRFELHQSLMVEAELRGDTTAVEDWGRRWLAMIDGIHPSGEDERSALDVARMDAVSELGTKQAALDAIPAFQASERAMPANYNASLRLAQAQVQAERYDDAVASCDRGLAKVRGPMGRTWLLEVKAQALAGKDDLKGARGVLDEAQKSAQAINTPNNRDGNLRRIERMKRQVEAAQK